MSHVNFSAYPTDQGYRAQPSYDGNVENRNNERIGWYIVTAISVIAVIFLAANSILVAPASGILLCSFAIGGTLMAEGVGYDTCYPRRRVVVHHGPSVRVYEPTASVGRVGRRNFCAPPRQVYPSAHRVPTPVVYG